MTKEQIRSLEKEAEKIKKQLKLPPNVLNTIEEHKSLTKQIEKELQPAINTVKKAYEQNKPFVESVKKTLEQYQKEIERLNKWAHAYYVNDNPIAIDEEYDKLYHEVLDYETANPSEVAEDSPTKRVGGVVRDEFSKASHIKRMWSMEDVFTTEEVQEWLDRTVKNVGECE